MNRLERRFYLVDAQVLPEVFLKVIRAKELLAYGELTLNEIADRLGYSSAAYLSAQFKSVEGRTPTDFRRDDTARRKPIDAV